MGLPRNVKNQITLDKVYQTASELLYEYGYDYLTIRNICEKAGVAYSSIYHFFGSKEELIYQYCTRLLKETVENNPLPASQDENDFVSCIMWYYFLYMSFLERMGPKVTQVLYTSSGKDLFDDVFKDDYIAKYLHLAAANGYLNLESPRHTISTKAEIFALLQSDLSTLLAGTVLNWIRLGTGSRNVPPRVPLTRVMNRFLTAWKTDSYLEKFGENIAGFQGDFTNPSFYNELKLPDYVKA